MDKYSVKKLARLAGVSVRTLHLYDKMGLLQPSVRTEARYRLYGEKELLRLQQILFYRELDIPLKDIQAILDDPAFDLELALVEHRKALLARKERIDTLVGTIDKTLVTLKNKTMLHPEDLYEGLPQEKMKAWRAAAVAQWGQQTVTDVEDNLRDLGRDEMKNIQTALNSLTDRLLTLMAEGPESDEVQQCIAERHQIILRLTGGEIAPAKLAYLRKMGELYAAENPGIPVDGLPDEKLATFMQEATAYYISNK